MRNSFFVLLCALASVFISPYADIAAQSTTSVATPLKYDVVSVKPNKTDSFTMGFNYDQGDTLTVEHATLQAMLSVAYDRQYYLIEGTPDWGKTLHFDIQGKILDTTRAQIDALTQDQRRAMFAAVLQDRFGLKTHWVTREEPEYELVATKKGSRMKVSTEKQTSSGLNMNEWEATRITTDDIARGLALRLEKPVVNHTNLSERYDIHLKWSVEGPRSDDDTQDSQTAPSLFTALKETLGLEIRPTRGPVQVLVVDAAELPSQN